MTAVLDPPTTRHARRTVERDELTPDAIACLSFVLNTLGTADGLIDDEPPTRDARERQHLSTFAAHAVGITITPGHEIAQCNTCALVMDGALAEEDGGRIRCTDCRADWQATLGQGPDTTAEAHDWDD